MQIPQLDLDKVLFLDFEFRNTLRRYVEVVAGAIHFQGKTWAIDLRTSQGPFKTWLETLPPATVICGYNVDAEIRSLYSIFKSTDIPFNNFLCLRREHLCLANKSYEISGGEVIQKGIKRNLSKFQYGGEKYGASCNLLNALWKFLGIYDAEHVELKERIVGIILEHPEQIDDNMNSILNYARKDVASLPALLQKMWATYLQRVPPELQGNLKREMLFRGTYAKITAKKVQEGYHVNIDGLKGLCKNAVAIVNKQAEYINETFPDKKTFSLCQKTDRYVYHDLVVSDFIDAQETYIKSKFTKTAKRGIYSQTIEVFETLFPNKHNLEKKDYLQQIYKYKLTASALRGLSLEKTKWNSPQKKFGDYFDEEEGVVRPYYNDYGSQTARCQPRANGYLLLKPAWMRKLVIPPPNKLMLYGDYGKEEILILAVLSGDIKLLEAYASGDPYVAFGLAKGILSNTMARDSEDWVVKRDACKQIMLSFFYGIGANSLGHQLSVTLKTKVSAGHAQNYINMFASEYYVATRFFRDCQRAHTRQKFLRLRDGWFMWADNFRPLSVKNFLVQGTGSTVMRFFDLYQDQRGIVQPLNLHDSFIQYIDAADGAINPDDVVSFVRGMRLAFAQALGNAPGCDLITVDIKIIGKGLPLGGPEKLDIDNKTVDIEYSDHYIDKRALGDLHDLKKYI